MKSLFSLSWFKSEKAKEYESLVVEEQKIRNEILRKQLNVEPLMNDFILSTKLVNNTLTVVLRNGDILSKPNASIEDFKKVKACTTEETLIDILMNKEELKKISEEECNGIDIEKIVEGIGLLKQTEDFEINEGSVYLKGIKRSIPALLVDKFGDVILKHIDENWKVNLSTLTDDVEYNSLKKFWMKCCLNPNAQSAEDLYAFLSKHNMKIDRHGNFYAYRRVVSVTSNPVDRELVDFVSNAYNKVKAVWKKKCSEYCVYFTEEEYRITKISNFNNITSNDIIKNYGNLEALYLNLPNMTENRYTDDRTHKMDYRVGQIASIPRHEGDDDNTRSCSKGLHIASKEYDYSGFGDTPILVIVNPMDVLAAPLEDKAKLRTCRWFFAMTLPEDEKYILEDDDFDVTELGDIFEKKCLENMREYVQNSFAEEVKRHTFSLPTLSAKEVEDIASQLLRMKEVVDGRVNKF